MPFWSDSEHTISIHALREEGDREFVNFCAEQLDFYPRPPRGGRPEKYRDTQAIIEFLSTPSARRATRGVQRGQQQQGDFYPRPPRGGRLPRPTIRTQAVAFLSTPSARRATLPSCWKITRRQNFYPRPPRGGRHQQGLEKMWSRKFLSTPSARRATLHRRSSGRYYGISIHALREEGDPATAARSHSR